MIYSVKQYGRFEETSWTLEKEEDVLWWLTNVMAHTPVSDDLIELQGMILPGQDIFDESAW